MTLEDLINEKIEILQTDLQSLQDSPVDVYEALNTSTILNYLKGILREYYTKNALTIQTDFIDVSQEVLHLPNPD